MPDRPVLYLDLDDTLVRWKDGRPSAAPGAREFVLWALDRAEIRWLTTWCPDGRMKASLLADLSRMLDLPTDTLRHIRGFDWDESRCKLNGIAWLEHVVQGRDFVWVEDERGVGERELRVLEDHDLRGHYLWCNVSREPESLGRVHETLEERWGG